MQHQQNSQNQQALMTHPPTVISTKDELYLKDILSWNLLVLKKAHFYAQNCVDPEVKAALNQAGQMHQHHYQKVLHHIQSHLQQSTQPNQQIQ